MTRLRSLRLPPEADVPFVVAAAAVWSGVAAAGLLDGPSTGAVAALAFASLGIAAALIIQVNRLFVAIAAGALALGLGVGVVAAAQTAAVHDAALPAGRTDVVGVVLNDPAPERFGQALVVDVTALRSDGVMHDTADVRLIVRGNSLEAEPGDVVVVEQAVLRSRPGWHRGIAVTGSVTTDELVVIGSVRAAHLTAGNGLRRRVIEALDDRHTQAEALSRGFLIGDVSRLGGVEQEELRRSGLTHFVAVSGGNVALFLAGVWVLLLPVPVSSQVRSAIGLAALAVFVVMTRWEPSVVRAAAMAALLLVGKVVGLPVDPWRALGGGVAAVLLLAPHLVGSAGFHLSVAATCGLLLTSDIAVGRRPKWVWRGLTASTAAQVSVLPLLLVYFDTVPLLAPLANVVAAPLVAASTILAGVGVVAGSSLVVDGGVAVAGIVLEVARVAATGPQLGPLGVAVALGVGTMTAFRSARILGVAVAVAAFLLGSGSSPVVLPDSVTVLDVGQGDAVLITGADGSVVAVDAGPDPVIYLEALRRVGLDRLDLLVITHGDSDHVGGAVGLLDRVAVGAIWVPRRDPPAPLVASVIDEALALGIPVRRPIPGTLLDVGAVQVEVIGPARRYEAENDGSTVLWLTGPRRTMLLGGDVQAVAQRELPPLRPDVLLVPHHGSATTDPEWLRRTVGAFAVVSVGPNTYGHPSAAVLDVLAGRAVHVMTTQDDGDIVVPLG